MENNPIYQLNNLIKGKIISRPSKHCKTPYVADVMLYDENENELHEVIAHAPSLGCCGYADKEQYVYLMPHENPKTCSHVIHLAHREEKNKKYLIGIHPKSAEKIVKICLESNYIESLKNLKELKAEQCFLNSRFDFCGIDENGKQFILEVKNVPCADYEDIFSKERKKKNYDSWAFDSKIAYFPDGYRKKNTDVVSPRALKHIQELEELKRNNSEIRCIIVFVIQRNDVMYFQGSNIDPIYKTALNKAYENGVEIIPIITPWEFDGTCYFNKEVKFKT